MTVRQSLVSAALAVAFFALSGCTAAQKMAIGQGVEAARQAKDTEAEILKVAVCAMSIGAYHRVNSNQERRALDVLCGGSWDRPITADDVRIIQRLGGIADGPRSGEIGAGAQ